MNTYLDGFIFYFVLFAARLFIFVTCYVTLGDVETPNVVILIIFFFSMSAGKSEEKGRRYQIHGQGITCLWENEYAYGLQNDGIYI